MATKHSSALERELAEKDAEIARQTRDYRASIAKSDEGKNVLAGTIRQLREEVARLTAERDEAKEAAEKVGVTRSGLEHVRECRAQCDVATARAERLATELRKVEWRGSTTIEQCPACLQSKANGHHRCTLAAALEETK